MQFPLVAVAMRADAAPPVLGPPPGHAISKKNIHIPCTGLIWGPSGGKPSQKVPDMYPEAPKIDLDAPRGSKNDAADP